MADPQGGAVTFGEEDLDEQSPVTFGESDISQEHPPAAKSAQRTSRAVTFGEHEIDKPVTFGEEEISGSDAQRFPYADAAGKLHTASHSQSDDEIWKDVQADKAKSLPAKTTPLGGNPLGPGSVGYKTPAPAPPRPQLRFTDVWYPRVSTEAQAGAARTSSPRATASKAAGMPVADVAGKPQEPQGEVTYDRGGLPHQNEAVPEAAGWKDPLLHIATFPEPLASGLSDIYQASPGVTGLRPAPLPQPHEPKPLTVLKNGKWVRNPELDAAPPAPVTIPDTGRGDPHVPRTPEEQSAYERYKQQSVRGVSEVVDAAGRAGMVFAPAAAIESPIATGLDLAAGTVLSPLAGKAAHKLGATPEEEDLARTLAFFIPSARIAARGIGLKTAKLESPQGDFSAAEALGGRVKAGIARTPDMTSGRVKIGGTQFEVNVPRNGGRGAEMPPAISENVPVSPNDTPGTQTELRTVPVPSGGSSSLNVSVPVERTITPQAVTSAAKTHRDAVNAMVQANATETIAKNVVAGRPAVPPAPALPPTPSQQFGNKLDGSHIAAMAQVIASHPPAQRDALIDEAHSNLSRWISDNGKVFIDGKIHIVRNPDQADVLAAKLVNEAVAKHDRATSSAAQQPAQESTSAPAPVPAPVPAQPMQQFLRTTRPTPKPAATSPVSVGQQPTTQNLTGNEGSRGEVIPPSPGQSVAKPEARDVVATGEKQAPIIEGNNPKEIQQFAEQDIQPDRRTNLTERKRVADMNPEEMARELHTSRLDNGDGTHTEMPIPNGRAFHDAPASPAVAMSDSDGLKAFNDKFGYKAGNALLVAKGEAAKEAGLDAYHQKGDEFLYHGESPEQLKTGLEKAREILKNRTISVEQPDGKVLKFKGADFSYGTGTDLAGAEKGLHAHKESREASGERKRGELRSITQVGSEPGKEDHGGTQKTAAEVAPQTFHKSEIEHELPEGVPAKGQAGRVPVDKLVLEPKRFQYKMNVNEKGVTNLLSGRRWNDELAGVVSVWRDPKDGKLYVVNGHHRVHLAKENHVPDLLVRHLNVDTAEEARSRGALQNIAEGRGTAVDAAKFFRDTGMGPEQLDKQGISLGEATAANGLALSKLDPSIFEKVATGKMSEGRGVAIGQATDDPAHQEAIVKLLDKREAQGKNVTEATVAELARFVASSGNRTVEQGGLFGANQQIHSLALEKAEISAYIKQQIAKERRVFSAVSSESKAQALQTIEGQSIKASENRQVAEAAAQAEEAYNKLSSYAGPVNEALDNAARELASGYHKPQDIKSRAYATVREEIRKTLSGGNDASAGRLQGRPAVGAEPKEADVRQQGSVSPGNAPALPQKGDTVTLKGGQVGTVKYVDPQMGVVRIQLASGETKTFPLRDVVTSGNRSGEAGFARMDVPSTLAKAALRRLLEPSDETKIARSVDDRLFDLEKHYEADVLRAKKLLESITTTPADQEAIYHHIEDPSSPVTPSQQRFIDEYINPLNDASRQMRATLNGLGVPVGEAPPGYIHRIVQGRASQLGRATAGKKGTGKGNVLSKHASSLQRRQMFAAERTGNEQLPLSDEQRGPNRIVVHRGDGKITGFQDGEGFEFAKDKPGLNVGDTFKDKDGDEWTLTQATTKEIEQHTNLRYYKNALATSIADYLQLRRAERAVDALEAMKEDPEFQRMAFKSNHGDMPPEGWRPTTLPQFMGWSFEPRTAEVLERYARQMHGEPYTVLDRIGNFMTASLLLNPVRHIFNIANHWLVERGVSGNFNPLAWPKAAQAGIRAIKAVTTQNEDFLDALDQGAPMMSHRQDLQQLHQKLYELLLEHLESDHTDREKIAQFVGLEPKNARDHGLLSNAARISGFRLLDNMRLYGQRTMWMSNDIFMLQSAYEKQLRDPNLSFKDAMAQVAKHIPDYRVPDRVMNSKRLSDVMRHPLLTIFSRYHYGVWKSYGQMLRETFSPDSSLKDRARGIDHMFMLGLVTFVLYELWDHVLKSATGDKNARMVRSGASAVPSAIQQVVKGQREPGDLVTASLTPNPLLKTGAEIALNRDSYTGSKVYDEHDSGLNILSDIGMHAVAPLGPVQQVKNASHQDQPTRNFLLSQGGITFPKYESQTPAQKLMHDIMRDNLSITPELRRELQDRRDRIARGEMSQKERKSQMRKAALDEFQFYLPHLRYSEIKQVFHAGTPEEKEIIRPIMLKKAVQIMRSNPFEGQREGALDAFNEK